MTKGLHNHSPDHVQRMFMRAFFKSSLRSMKWCYKPFYGFCSNIPMSSAQKGQAADKSKVDNGSVEAKKDK